MNTEFDFGNYIGKLSSNLSISFHTSSVMATNEVPRKVIFEIKQIVSLKNSFDIFVFVYTYML